MFLRPNPNPLTKVLNHLVTRILHLTTPIRSQASVQTRLQSLIQLITQLIAQLTTRQPERPITATRPTASRERPDSFERPERPESFTPRPIPIPILVARICRELAALAKLLDPAAQAELIALATRAQQAAQAWQTDPPPTPQRPSSTGSTRGPPTHNNPNPRQPAPNNRRPPP